MISEHQNRLAKIKDTDTVTIISRLKPAYGTTSDMYSGTRADEIPIPMPASSRPIIIVCTLWAVALVQQFKLIRQDPNLKVLAKGILHRTNQRKAPTASGMASNWKVLVLPNLSANDPPVKEPTVAPARDVLTIHPSKDTPVLKLVKSDFITHFK